MPYTGPALSTNGSHIHQYGGANALLGAVPGVKEAGHLPLKVRLPRGLQLDGQAKYWMKGDTLYGCVAVRTNHGAKLIISASVPLAPIRKAVERYHQDRVVELGWNPFKSIAKSGRWLGRTVKKAAKSKVAKKLVDIAKSPEFQKYVLEPGAMAAGAYFGVPPQATKAAIQMVKAASNKQLPPDLQQHAMAKVSNITSLAQQGNPSAEKLWAVMSTYYRGGVPALQNAPAQFSPQYAPQPPAPPTPAPTPYPYPQYPQYPPQQYTNYPPRVPQQYALPPYYQTPVLPYGLQRLAFTGPRGTRISGWVYNVPYRGNFEAMSLDKKNPLHAIRFLYNKGMQK